MFNLKFVYICERLLAFRILQNDNEELEGNMEFYKSQIVIGFTEKNFCIFNKDLNVLWF